MIGFKILPLRSQIAIALVGLALMGWWAAAIGVQAAEMLVETSTRDNQAPELYQELYQEIQLHRSTSQQRLQISTISLRPQLIIRAAHIKLSDLFIGLAPEQDRIVAPAPAPGRKVRFDATLLHRMARAHQINWQPLDRRESATITRASHVIGPDQIKTILSPHLIKSLGGEEVDITLDMPNFALHFPLGKNGYRRNSDHLEIANVDLDARTGRFKATLLMTQDGRSKPVSLTGRAVDQILLPALKRNFRKGEIVSKDEIIMIAVPRLRAPSEPISFLDDIVGKQTHRTVFANKPLVKADLRNPIVVKRGQVIAITYQTRLMSLSTRGQAMHDAGIGDDIRVRNTESETVVQARVISSEEAVITPQRRSHL